MSLELTFSSYISKYSPFIINKLTLLTIMKKILLSIISVVCLAATMLILNEKRVVKSDLLTSNVEALADQIAIPFLWLPDLFSIPCVAQYTPKADGNLLFLCGLCDMDTGNDIFLGGYCKIL